MTLQRDVFKDVEGDSYFRRNEKQSTTSSPTRSVVTERMSHHLRGAGTPRVLEVGCASGANLSALSALTPIEGFGIDPSCNAIQVGHESFPELDLKVGTADQLPYNDGTMDAIWFGFCLYLVDRGLLHRVIAEADRVLKDGGFIVIHDFDPDVAFVRPYMHRAGLNSYKMNYSGLFLSDPAYSLVEKMSFTHDDVHWTDNAQERLGLWVCRKNVKLGYREG
jgi:ubiquinone/menaquinone biosynthesis C-methylase UbiE